MYVHICFLLTQHKCAVHPRIRKAHFSSMTLIHRDGEGGDNNGEFNDDYDDDDDDVDS